MALNSVELYTVEVKELGQADKEASREACGGEI